MKAVYVIALLWPLVVCYGCESVRPVQNSDPFDQVTIITVDCRNEAQVTSQVKQLLRMARVSDWIIRDNGSSQDIEARYREISPRVQADIEDQLKQSAGVLNVAIKTEHILLKHP